MNNNFTANNNYESEQTLDINCKTINNNIETNTSNLNDLSNIIDSSLVSYLNNESLCTSLTISETTFNSLFNTDQTHSNTIDKSGEKCLEEMHMNRENLISMERVSGI